MMTDVTTGLAGTQARETRAALQGWAFAIGAICVEDFPGPLLVDDRKVEFRCSASPPASG